LQFDPDGFQGVDLGIIAAQTTKHTLKSLDSIRGQLNDTFGTVFLPVKIVAVQILLAG